MYRIKCPTCGAEYFPQEIFVLSGFANSRFAKDGKGEILDKLNIDTNETYICDYCDTAFTVDMNLSFDVSKYEPTPHVTKLKKTPLFLDEE